MHASCFLVQPLLQLLNSGLGFVVTHPPKANALINKSGHNFITSPFVIALFKINSRFALD
jgi:hypothetical protein